MAINISLALRNALLQGTSVKEALGGGFIYFYAGTVPADADAALDMTVTTGVHTQLAKIAADATPVADGITGLTFDAVTNGALPKAPAQTWAGIIDFVGKDQAQAGVSALTASFFRFVGTSRDAGIPAPQQDVPTTATTGGTLAAATYYYVVTALTAAGETARSNERSIATTGTTSSNTVNWGAVAGATSYRVYRGATAGGEDTYYTSAAGTTSFIDTGAAGTAAAPPAQDKGQVAGTASTTPRIQGSIAVSGGDINLSSVSLSDNGTNQTGLASFEVRMPSA